MHAGNGEDCLGEMFLPTARILSAVVLFLREWVCQREAKVFGMR